MGRLGTGKGRDVLGLTHPGYELSPLRGCGDTVERDLGKGKNARGQAFHPVNRSLGLESLINIKVPEV